MNPLLCKFCLIIPSLMVKEKIEPSSMKKTPTTSNEKSKKPQKLKTTTHPPYFQMIKEALMALKEKNGSSPYAIAKQIEEKYKPVLPENFRKTLSLQLKNSLAKGKLVKIRASYMITENTNTRTARPKKEEKERKTTRSSSRRSKKTMPVNKQEVTTMKKRKARKPRQPKSIKSTAGKKALKASAT